MLKLSIINTEDPAKLSTCQLQTPGGTIGSNPENDLVLADDINAIGKVQAALRMNAQGDIVLVNLCSTSPIFLNGIMLAFKQQAPFGEEDRISLGSYILQALTETETASETASAAAAVSVSAEPAAPIATPVSTTSLAPAVLPVFFEQATAAPAPIPAPPAEDIFADLLNSPGVLPIGAPIQEKAHPFDMASASDRNHADPVSLLSPQGVHQPMHHRDPLSMLSRDGTEQHRATIFSDSSPSTVRQMQELAEHREDRILQALKQAAYNSDEQNTGI